MEAVTSKSCVTRIRVHCIAHIGWCPRVPGSIPSPVVPCRVCSPACNLALAYRPGPDFGNVVDFVTVYLRTLLRCMCVLPLL